MAKIDIERAFAKCLEKSPLLREELEELNDMAATELMEYGTVAESAWVRQWVRHATYRWRAQDVSGARDPGDAAFAKPPTSTYPYYDEN